MLDFQRIIFALKFRNRLRFILCFFIVFIVIALISGSTPLYDTYVGITLDEVNNVVIHRAGTTNQIPSIASYDVKLSLSSPEQKSDIKKIIYLIKSSKKIGIEKISEVPSDIQKKLREESDTTNSINFTMNDGRIIMMCNYLGNKSDIDSSNNNSVENKMMIYESDTENIFIINSTELYNWVIFNRIFVDKQVDILWSPYLSVIKKSTVKANTVLNIMKSEQIGDDYWVYVQAPVNDDSNKHEGWINANDAMDYTKNMKSMVQSEVQVKQGEFEYETSKIEDLSTVSPMKAAGEEYGRIEDKQRNYVKVVYNNGRTVWVSETSIIYPEAYNYYYPAY